MVLDPVLREELTRDEGCRLAAYKDTAGLWTIGVGHLLGPLQRMVSITPAESDALLAYDIEQAEKIAIRAVPMFHILHDDRSDGRAYDVRWRALVNMAFNRGNNMCTSTTITPAINDALQKNDWSGVAAVIAASPWAKQVGARATRLAFMLEHGEVMP